MSFVIIITVFAVVLFASAYFSKRRFGVLGLGLAAGAVLSELWATSFMETLRDSGIIVIQPPLLSITTGLLILAPALALLFSGSKYTNTVQQAIGSVAFAVLGVTLLLKSFEMALVIDGSGKQLFDVMMQYKVLLITGGVVYAVVDLFLVRKPKPVKDGPH